MVHGTYVERALFMVGDQNTGKSTQLRSMFLDWRLGNQGTVPTARNVRNSYALSNERWLYLRLTSPHEAGETLDEFLDKCANEMQASPPARRWNFAGALQPDGTAKLPEDCPGVVSAFAARFSPERIRVAILSPDRFGAALSTNTLENLTTALRKIPDTEVLTADATARTANGLIYADFFDFT